jgi:hypothetical protein
MLPPELIRAAFDLGQAHAQMVEAMTMGHRTVAPQQRPLFLAQSIYWLNPRTQEALWAVMERALQGDPGAPLSVPELHRALGAAAHHGWYRPSAPAVAWQESQVLYARLLDQLPSAPDLLRPCAVGG